MIAAIKCPHVFMNGYKNRKFNQEDLNAADIVSSLMSSAFDRIHMIETIKSRGSFFQMIINSTDVGIVSLDLRKKPLFINKKAISICEKIKKEPITPHAQNNIKSLICGNPTVICRQSKNPLKV